jgi:hypothetical protein
MGRPSASQQRRTEEAIQRSELGPRAVPGKEDPAKMTPQRVEKTPGNNDPGHTA